MTALATTFVLLACQDQAADLRQQLKSKRISVEFKDQSMKDVARALSDATGLNFSLYDVRDRDVPAVTLTLTDCSVETVLALILDERRLAWRIEDNVVLIGTRAILPMSLRGYDCRDLVYVARDFPGIDIDPGRDTLGVIFTEREETPAVDTLDASWLVELVKAHTGRGSWEENPRVSISAFDGCLLVRQTDEIHGQIEKLLNELRKIK